MEIILAVSKHSIKIPSDNESLKSIKIVEEIKDAKILYINTGIFMRSVELFLTFPSNEGLYSRLIIATPQCNLPKP